MHTPRRVGAAASNRRQPGRAASSSYRRCRPPPQGRPAPPPPAPGSRPSPRRTPTSCRAPAARAQPPAVSRAARQGGSPGEKAGVQLAAGRAGGGACLEQQRLGGGDDGASRLQHLDRRVEVRLPPRPRGDAVDRDVDRHALAQQVERGLEDGAVRLHPEDHDAVQALVGVRHLAHRGRDLLRRRRERRACAKMCGRAQRKSGPSAQASGLRAHVLRRWRPAAARRRSRPWSRRSTPSPASRRSSGC